MLCNKIRELLMSDYLDGELDRKAADEVKEHLLKCHACSRLSDELQAQHEVIVGTKKQAPPDSVWQNIRSEVMTEKSTAKSTTGVFLGRLREAFLAPRPVFTLAAAVTAIVCLLVVGAIARNYFFYTTNGEDDLSMYMLNGQSTDSINDLGTSIEEYFL